MICFLSICKPKNGKYFAKTDTNKPILSIILTETFMVWTGLWTLDAGRWTLDFHEINFQNIRND